MSEIARGHGSCLPAWKHSAVDLPRAASRSVVIVMIVMGGVPLSVMQVVDVIAVRHGGVPAAGLVPVSVALDGRVLRDLALRPLPFPLAVHVAVVRVVDVVGVLEGHVPTALAVLVAVVVVDQLTGGHRVLRR